MTEDPWPRLAAVVRFLDHYAPLFVLVLFALGWFNWKMSGDLEDRLNRKLHESGVSWIITTMNVLGIMLIMIVKLVSMQNLRITDLSIRNKQLVRALGQCTCGPGPTPLDEDPKTK